MDGGAWWAAAYGAAQSWTQLNQLRSSSNRYTDGFEVVLNRVSWVSKG